ncbi:glutenin, low molecular weight subunit, partial [Drosophila sechellia]|uniref:glutenin, low molecular weight subunit n=1 Tax=Drosophila sechellia TaxID=7238 RepID=UPI0013DE1CBF
IGCRRRRSPLKLYSYKYHNFDLFRHQTLHSHTSNKMKTYVLTLALCACLAAADVSHLQPSTSYLPPPRPEHAVSMSIEQQELRELPEQVEYMRPNEQGQMEPMPSSLLTPPAAVDQQEAMPSSRYLPPAPAPVAVPVQMAIEQMMMPQIEVMTPQEAVMEKFQQQPELAHRYLPPAPVSEQQLTYQQYQEQMQQIQMHDAPQEQQPQQLQEQQVQEEQQPTYVLDVQQPMAPSDVETQEQLEPEPAHELRADGYHYKQAEEQRRLRH